MARYAWVGSLAAASMFFVAGENWQLGALLMFVTNISLGSSLVVYDAILCDLRMPDLDGPALYRELTAQRPELLSRIVFMTGDTLGGDMSGFLTDTGVRVLEKPLDPAGVRAKVQTYLASRASAAPVTSR